MASSTPTSPSNENIVPLGVPPPTPVVTRQSSPRPLSNITNAPLGLIEAIAELTNISDHEFLANEATNALADIPLTDVTEAHIAQLRDAFRRPHHEIQCKNLVITLQALSAMSHAFHQMQKSVDAMESSINLTRTVLYGANITDMQRHRINRHCQVIKEDLDTVRVSTVMKRAHSLQVIVAEVLKDLPVFEDARVVEIVKNIVDILIGTDEYHPISGAFSDDSATDVESESSSNHPEHPNDPVPQYEPGLANEARKLKRYLATASPPAAPIHCLPPPTYHTIKPDGEKDGTYWESILTELFESSNTTLQNYRGIPITIYQGGRVHAPLFIGHRDEGGYVVGPTKKAVAAAIVNSNA